MFCGGAALQGGETCEALFHQMLYWENELPELGSLHHLMVLCCHLQHPSLLSQAGLDYGVELLRDFLENGWMSTQRVICLNSQVTLAALAHLNPC